MKKTWWKEAVAYQIYPRSFMDANGDGIGDIQGVIERLDYLEKLGIDVIWVCPIFSSPNVDNGYDISDYRGILAEFGTMADVDSLIKEVHKRGMKIIFDLVINHTSDEHPWFMESRVSKRNRKRDWYIWRDGVDGKEPNNWESIFGGSAWEYDAKTKQYYLHLFDKKQPDLNWENNDMCQAVYQMINWWLDKGIDGFRIDAITHIKKEEGFSDLPNPNNLDYVPSFEKHLNQPGILDYLQELHTQTFANYDIMTVGEANGVKVKDAKDWVGEKKGVFDMVFHFEHLGLWDRKDFDLRDLKKVLTKWQKGLEKHGWNALFLENHDQPRSVSTWGNDSFESAKALAALYFLMKGTPFIYQGQEIGMTNVRFETMDEYDDIAMKNLYDIETKKGVPPEEVMEIIWKRGRDNSRTPMQWSDDTNAGFSKNTPWMGVNENYVHLNVENQWNDKHSVLHFYQKMIRLRKEHKVLKYGRYDLIMKNDKQIYAYTRTLNKKKAVIIVNMSDKKATYHDDKCKVSSKQLVLTNYDVSKHKKTTRCKLKPYEVRVYLQD